MSHPNDADVTDADSVDANLARLDPLDEAAEGGESPTGSEEQRRS
jgi:hypothetical protein